jgi:hypothetical protein
MRDISPLFCGSAAKSDCNMLSPPRIEKTRQSGHVFLNDT